MQQQKFEGIAPMPSVHPGSEYRPDVDGLRCVAVASVLVFHAFPGVLPGGFVGVDVFFVISGYLISRIILGDLKNGTFTFRDFYSRRIRRIFPALIVVLVATMIVGWRGLLPADFRQLGVHVLGGVGFVSNLVLWGEAGYFDRAAEFKPLLHLWSLGVEEQYYLLWPLALFIFRKHIHRVFWLIVVVAVGSFALNVFSTVRYPTAAFYWPIPRFWELMVGSIIAYLHTFPPSLAAALKPTGGQAHALSTIGAALLVAGLLVVHNGRAFPGWWVLLPTLGTALCICAGSEAWFNRYVLSNRVAVFIGLISYPLYLWHWPLLTYARIFHSGELPSASVRAGILLASVALAWATYQLVEKKVRRARRTAWSHWVVPSLSMAMVLVGVYGVLAALTVAHSRSAAVPYLAVVSEAYDDWREIDDGLIRGDSDHTALFVGDSHMKQYLPRIEQVMNEHRKPLRSVYLTTRHGCAPVPNIERPGYGCDRFMTKALEIAHGKNVDTVIFAASWMGFAQRTDYFKRGEEFAGGKPLDMLAPQSQWVFDGFETALRSLREEGKRVVLVLCSPRGSEFDPRAMVRENGLDFTLHVSPAVSRSAIAEENAPMDRRLREIAARVGAIVVNPLDTLCPQGYCSAVDQNGAPLYKDETHMRSSYVAANVKFFDRFIYLDGEA